MEKCGQAFADHWRVRKRGWWLGMFRGWDGKSGNKQTRHIWAWGGGGGGLDRANRLPIRFDLGFLQVRAGDKNLSTASLLEEWS